MSARTVVTAILVTVLWAPQSFDLAPAANTAYLARLATTAVSAEAGNTFVVKPEAHVWYDLTRKIGVKLTGGYLLARPSVIMTSAPGEDSRRINAARIMVSVGLVYRIF